MRNNQQKMYVILRFAVAMCFIGHGAFGIITKPIWCNYFAVFGIGHQLAYRLMPLLGCFDIMIGIGMLVYPIRAIPCWLVIWGIFTALLRPLSGEPFAEFIERTGNFGVPILLLMLSGGIGKNGNELFSRMPKTVYPDSKTIGHVLTGLQLGAFLLLAGHGWLNMIEKKGLLNQYLSLGFTHTQETAMAIGIGEIIAAFSILILPFRPVIFFILIWKICSEFFYPQYEVFEWIERGGSYGILLALWLAVGERKAWLFSPMKPAFSVREMQR